MIYKKWVTGYCRLKKNMAEESVLLSCNESVNDSGCCQMQHVQILLQKEELLSTFCKNFL